MYSGRKLLSDAVLRCLFLQSLKLLGPGALCPSDRVQNALKPIYAKLRAVYLYGSSREMLVRPGKILLNIRSRRISAGKCVEVFEEGLCALVSEVDVQRITY